MTVADFVQVPPAEVKLIFSQFSNEDSLRHLLRLQLKHLCNYAKSTVAVKQRDKLFIDLLNKFWVGNIDGDVKS